MAKPTATTSTSKTSVAQALWTQAEPRALQSLYHPFVTGLAAGTLPLADFQAFLLQDAYYLHGFAKAFAYAVVKAKDTAHALALIRLMGSIEHELSNHSAFLESFGIDVFAVEDATAAPATTQYVDFLLSTATTSDSVATILAAMTPCMRLYAFIGQHVRAALGGLPTDKHPYSRWIASYATDAFMDAAKVTEDLLDDVAASECIDVATLAPLYNTAMALELCFFEQYSPLARSAHVKDDAALVLPLTVQLTIDDVGRLDRSALTLALGPGDVEPQATATEAIDDVLMALRPGDYTIHVARHPDNDKNDDESLRVTITSTTASSSFRRVPLLRTLVASGCAFIETLDDDDDAATAAAPRDVVVAQSALELLTLLRLLTARGRFDVYAHPLVRASISNDNSSGATAHAAVPPRVLIIAGSDSGGGAGVQADLKACTNLGVFSASAITAVTVQNTRGVHAIHPVPVNIIADQITCVLDDIGTDVVKTGMLFNDEIIEMVAAVLAPRQNDLHVVVDPVMVATSGDRLLKDAAHASLVHSLFPLASLITPNIPEASVLLDGRAITTLDDMKAAARDLAAFGSKFVLVKGGHLPEDASDKSSNTTVHDVLFDATTRDIHVFPNAKLSTINTHGTGCTLASAIAAELAKTRGGDMVGAVGRAIAYLHRVLVQSQHVALGTGGSKPMLHVV